METAVPTKVYLPSASFMMPRCFWQLLQLEVHICKYNNNMLYGQNNDRISKLSLIDRIFFLAILTEG
jgi:hypothetical protein